MELSFTWKKLASALNNVVFDNELIYCACEKICNTEVFFVLFFFLPMFAC